MLLKTRQGVYHMPSFLCDIYINSHSSFRKNKKPQFHYQHSYFHNLKETVHFSTISRVTLP